MNISDLDLSIRAYNCLKALDLRTVQEVLDYGINNLRNHRNVGMKTITEIEEIFSNITLEKTEPKIGVPIFMTSMTISEMKEILISPLIEEIRKLKKEEDVDVVFTKTQAQKFLNVSMPTLHKWTRKGILKSYKIQKRVYYKKSEILQSLNYENT